MLSNIIPVTGPTSGRLTFAVAHGLSNTPNVVLLTMIGLGSIFEDQNIPPDTTYVYLAASDYGLQCSLYVSTTVPALSGGAYTTLTALAQMFPAWTRGAANQQPTDTQATLLINDVASRINAVIGRRFREAMTQAGFTSAYPYAESLSADALNYLEQLNRWGAALELGEIFSTYGNPAAAKQAERYRQRFQSDFNELNGEDAKGSPKPDGGDFDYLFDPQSKTPTPRATMWGIAGGDQSHNYEGEGTTAQFKKFDPKGT